MSHGPVALSFDMDADRGRLAAVLGRADPAMPALDRQTVIDALIQAGWAALHRDDAAIDRLLDAAAAGEPLKIDIAERRDARCTVQVAGDAMTATLTLTPAFGGAELERADIDRALHEAGVVSGILEEEIRHALERRVADRWVVARGRAPDPGTPARFESLIPDIRRRGPSVDARGIAHYRELGTLLTVHAGDPLMRRVPATPGRDGENVRGEVLAAAPVDDPPFAADLRGASVAADDPDLLRADIAGQPVLQARGVSVEPTIRVPSVDLGSGNIDFDGTVKVSGDVAAGMHVRASGDVIVAGTVEAAHIEAGGNIVVAAGAIGVGTDTGRARLVAGGTVSVRFCENCVVEAGGDVLVGEFALHCELVADHGIVVGKPGAARSRLIGGVARAGATLAVNVLGSPAGVLTQIEVGYHPQAHAQLTALRSELAASETRLEGLHQVLAYTETLDDAHHRELRGRAQRTLVAAEHEHTALLDRRAEAEARLVLAENAQVVVSETVHPGVELRLGNLSLRTQDSAGAGVFRLQDGQIVYAGL